MRAETKAVAQITNGKTFQPKACVECGKSYTPCGAAQKRCDRCRDGAEAAPPKPKPSREGVSRGEVPAVRTNDKPGRRVPASPAAQPSSTGLLQGLRGLSSVSGRASELMANIARDSDELATLLGDGQ